jgi:formate dehydrogenase subunit gamma
MGRHTPWSEDRAHAIIAEHQHLRGALLPMLHALHHEFGFIHQGAIALLAKALNLSRADVHGVVSFYHEFRREQPGAYVLKVCRAEACQAMGANALIAHIKDHLKIDFGATTADGKFSLEAVYCLGNCALSPAMLVDNTLYGRVSPARFNAITASLPAASQEVA